MDERTPKRPGYIVFDDEEEFDGHIWIVGYGLPWDYTGKILCSGWSNAQ